MRPDWNLIGTAAREEGRALASAALDKYRDPVQGAHADEVFRCSARSSVDSYELLHTPIARDVPCTYVDVQNNDSYIRDERVAR